MCFVSTIRNPFGAFRMHSKMSSFSKEKQHISSTLFDYHQICVLFLQFAVHSVHKGCIPKCIVFPAKNIIFTYNYLFITKYVFFFLQFAIHSVHEGCSTKCVVFPRKNNIFRQHYLIITKYVLFLQFAVHSVHCGCISKCVVFRRKSNIFRQHCLITPKYVFCFYNSQSIPCIWDAFQNA
jgi:hypothetical protein